MKRSKGSVKTEYLAKTIKMGQFLVFEKIETKAPIIVLYSLLSESSDPPPSPWDSLLSDFRNSHTLSKN